MSQSKFVLNEPVILVVGGVFKLGIIEKVIPHLEKRALKQDGLLELLGVTENEWKELKDEFDGE